MTNTTCSIGASGPIDRHASGSAAGEGVCTSARAEGPRLADAAPEVSLVSVAEGQHADPANAIATRADPLTHPRAAMPRMVVEPGGRPPPLPATSGSRPGRSGSV